MVRHTGEADPERDPNFENYPHIVFTQKYQAGVPSKPYKNAQAL